MKDYRDLDKRYRYSLRKFKVGVASVAIGAFFLISGNAALASEVTAEAISGTENPKIDSSKEETNTDNISVTNEVENKNVALENVIENRKAAISYKLRFVDENDKEVYSVVKFKEVGTSKEKAEAFVTNEDLQLSNIEELKKYERSNKNLPVNELITEGKDNVITIKVKEKEEKVKPKTVSFKATNTLPTDPKNNATERENEGQPLETGTGFRTVATPTVTKPLPEGYGISPEKLPEKLSFMADPDPNMLVFGILEHVPRNKFYSFAKNRVDNTYTVSVYDSASKARLSNDVISSVAGTTLTIDEGHSRVVVNHRSTEAGTSAIIFRAEAVTPDPTLRKLVLRGVYTDGYEDKRDPEASNNSTLDYYAPVLAYSATSHKDLLTDTKLQDDIVQSGYIGETYSTRALNREGEVGEKYDVIAPFNTTGALSNINWRGVGQVDEVVAEWAGGNVYDSSTGSVRTVTMFRKVRYEMINEQGDMKISVFYAEKLANNQPGEWHRAKVLNRKPADRMVMIPSTGKNGIYYDVVPDKYEVIVKSIFSDEGPYRGFFEGHKIGDTHKLIQDGNIQANHAASGVINVRNPFRQASDKIIYYYTQEIAEVKFFDDTYGTMSPLPEIVTGFRGKGNTVIDVNQGRTQDNKTVADIIEKYRALGYRVKVNEFEASDAPKFKNATATYPTHGTSSEDIIANETTRRNNNRRVVNITFEKPKGSVIVNYVNEAGETIKASETPVNDQYTTNEAGDPLTYDTTKTKSATLVGTDGKQYVLVENKTATTTNGKNFEVTNGAPTETGNVTEGTTYVNYVYKEKPKGSVIVNYRIEGDNDTVIKEPVEDTKDVYVGTDYTTTDHKTPEIEHGGKTYVLVPDQTPEKETGKVVEGTTEVTYVYREKPKGSVIVNYRIEGDNDTVIKEPVEDTKDVYVGTDYTTTDHKTPEIEHGGKTYVLVPDQTPEKETGKVVEGTTEVTYVYREKAKGSVVVNYTDENGTPITGTGNDGQPYASGVEDTKDAYVGTDYNTNDHRPETITTADGVTYERVPNLTKGEESGQVTEGTKTVTYVYKKVTGDVIVNYVDENGKPLKASHHDKDDANIGEDFNTGENETEKPTEIVANGKTYVLVPDKHATTTDGNTFTVVDGAPTETGDVAKTPTYVTYVYKEKPKGSVIVNYRIEGDSDTVIKEPVEDTKDVYVGTDYTTTDHKTPEIEHGGKTYVLVPDQTPEKETGKVVEGTTEVTYVYREKPKGSVIVNYVNEAGASIKASETPVNDEYTTNEAGDPLTYDTTNTKPATLVGTDGKQYVLVENKTATTTNGKNFEITNGAPTETGNVTEGTTYVNYVYKEKPKGSVIVNYVNEAGETIKASETPVNDQYTTNEAGDPLTYDTTKTKSATLVGTDGKQYVLVENKTATTTNGKNFEITNGAPTETGNVTEGTTYVNYVYKEKPKGSVIVNYVNEAGETIKTSETPVNDEYTTNENGTPLTYDTTKAKPTTLTGTDGKQYVLVADKKATTTNGKNFEVTDGAPTETGNVTEGTTYVNYVYKEKPKGSVIVNYVNEAGETIKTSETPVNDQYTTTEAGDPVTYDTTTTKPTTLTGTDGKQYVLVENKTATTTNGTNFEVTDGAPTETGNVTEGTTYVNYVYKEKPKGSVIVNYVNEAGETIKASETPVNDQYTTTEAGDPVTYDTTKTKPATLVGTDGKQYVLVENKTATTTNGTNFEVTDGAPTETGNVTEGTTYVNYVYKEKSKGSVIVNYVDESGNPISGIGNDNRLYEPGLKDTENVYVGTGYDTTDLKPKTIEVTLPDGTKKLYELVAVQAGSADEKGTVQEGTITVTYVYKEVTPVDPGKPGEQTPGVEIPETPENPTPQTPEQPGKQVEKLPNTGNTTTNNTLAGLGLLGLVALVTRRRKNNK